MRPGRKTRLPIGAYASLVMLLTLCLAGAGCSEGPKVTTEGPSPQGKASDAGSATGFEKNESLPEGVVALVNGEPITVEAFASHLLDGSFLALQTSLEGRLQVVGNLIERQLLFQDAREQGLADSPRLKRLIERRRRQLLLPLAEREIVLGLEKATDEEIDELVGDIGKLADLTVILVETEEFARELRDRVLAGEDMSQLAREHSITPGGAAGSSGGRKKSLERGKTMFPAAAEEVIYSLEPGAISPPLATPVGYVVVRLDAITDHTEEEIQGFRFKAQREIVGARVSEARAAKVAELEAAADIELLLAAWKDATLPDLDEAPPIMWQKLEDVDVARLDDVTLTLGDIFRNFRDYVLLMGKNPDAQERIFQSMRKERMEQVLLAQYAAEKGLVETAELDEALAAYSRVILPGEYRVELGLQALPGEPDDATCRELFNQGRSSYLEEPQLHLEQILVRRREEAESVRTRLGMGEEFASLARELSLHESSATGGDMGTVMAPELKSVFGAGGVDELLSRARRGDKALLTLRTTSGYHVLRIVEFFDVGQGEYEMVREAVLPDCKNFVRSQAVQERLSLLRSRAEIVLDMEKVENTPMAEGPGPGSSPHGGQPSGGPGLSPHGGGGPARGGSPHGGGGGGGTPPGHP